MLMPHRLTKKLSGSQSGQQLTQKKMDKILSEALSSAQTEANRIETEARAEFDAQTVHENRKGLMLKSLRQCGSALATLGRTRHILLEGLVHLSGAGSFGVLNVRVRAALAQLLTSADFARLMRAESSTHSHRWAATAYGEYLVGSDLQEISSRRLGYQMRKRSRRNLNSSAITRRRRWPPD